MARGIAILRMSVGPGGSFIWCANPGNEIFDAKNNKYLYRLEYLNTTSVPQYTEVFKNDDCSLDFSHADMRPSFSIAPYIPEISPVLPDPDFTLDEIELGRKIVEGSL